ncbi:MAG: N-6 DNA methylase [Candidatus Moraniibacteriota bacterium]
MSEERIILEEIIQDFSVEKFSRFFRAKSRQFVAREESYAQYDDADFENGLKLGEINFSDGDSLLLCTFFVKKELSERAGKKAQYEKAKNILKSTENQKFSAGIFIFSDANGNFRFSLIYPESIGTKRQWNNFRRFTYFVSREFTNKTFSQRIGDSDFFSVEKIKEAFSVEKVTKEFFNNYKKLFEKIIEYLRNDKAFAVFASQKGVELNIFAKKLLGQIVFIYFLQKKGWLGAKKGENISKGQNDFLRKLFTSCKEKGGNFFNDYLEYLFYDCLNKRSEKIANSYREKFDCQIPFLNGGLFEPMGGYNWKEDFINIDNKIFSNENEDGVLDVFDRYNFTIDENMPDDQEVSVDPEMLGKVFENLLEDNIRKGQGAFYTPREIVHYMCQESLINYLDSNSKIGRIKAEEYIKFRNVEEKISLNTSEDEVMEIDELLKNVKVCDPACGSGAFLVGMLNEIVKLRHLLRILKSDLPRKTVYDLKKETIQNCLYGVDIDPGATDIAKLRFWLSIVVDEDIDEVEPLPNLDYKIMQGNSLLEDLVVDGEIIKIKLGISEKIDGRTKIMKNLFEEDRQIKMLLYSDEKALDKEMKIIDQYHQEYFNFKSDNSKEKKILKNKIDKKESEIIEIACNKKIKELQSWNLNNINQKDKILKNTNKILAVRGVLNKWKVDHLRPFFPWKLHFGEVFNRENGGFDIVIGNPPYIKEYIDKSAFVGLHKNKYYQGKMDLWYMFACMGNDFLNDSGIECFIAQNNWVTSSGASKMRNKIIADTQIVSLVDFGNYKIFETAGIQTMIMLFKKSTSKHEYVFDYRRLRGDDLFMEDVVDVLKKMQNPKAEYLEPKINRNSLVNKKLTFSNPEDDAILDKIIKKSDFKFDSKKEVAQGIVYPQDKLNKSNQEILGKDFKVGDGIFVLNNQEKEQIIFTEKELEIIKPSYTTKDLTKWWTNLKNSEWVIYTDSSFKDIKKINDYPNIKKHLDKFKKVITSDNRPYGLHRSRDEYFFKGEKIIVARKCAVPTFAYTDFDSYVSATFYVIKTERVNQKYLTGLLNSRLMCFWLKYKGKMQGSNFQIDKDPIIDLPLIDGSKEEQGRIINLVDQSLTIKKQNKDADTKNIESQIDQLVYELYGLAEEEIGIVENSMRKSM